MSDDALQLPFAPLNLRRNPFGQVPIDERPQLAVVDVEEWVEAVQGGTVVEFVGRSGRGKSTHLRVLAAHLPEAAYVHVHKDRPPPAMPDRPVLCVDEAQFLPPRRRRALYRRDAPLALGTHASLADEIEAADRVVKTVSLDDRPVDASLLRQIVDRRLEWARRNEGNLPQLSDEAVTWLLERYGDNLRAIEHHLYAVFQHLDSVRTVGPDDLERAETPPAAITNPVDPPVRESMGTVLRRRICSVLRRLGTTLLITP